MKNTFNTRVDRTGSIQWLKDYFTPDYIKEQNMLGYAGAEFEFPTCPAFCRGVKKAAEKGLFGFTLVGNDYRNAVKWWMRELRDYEVQADWIVPTQGTIFSLATTIRLFTEPGDNIMVLSPNYSRYNQAATRLKRGTVTIPFIEDKGRYSVDFVALAAAFAKPENKLLVICNPNNPTGHVYSREELEQIAELSKQYKVAVFSDEIFAEIVFENDKAIPYAQVAGSDALAITCTSMGKVFSLTGVNHANLIIENTALREAYIEQRNADHFGSVDPMTYAGMMEAYSEEGKDWVLALRQYVWENVLLLEQFVKKNLPQARMIRPQGTFVVWVDYSSYEAIWPELDRVLQEEGLFVGDGGEEYFGKNTCVRYSLAVPKAELMKTLDQVATALQTWQLR